MNEKHIRRSLLFVPGSSEKMLAKAEHVQSDSVIIDLEDAVSIDEKAVAREYAAKYVHAIRTAGKEAIVRINDMSSPYCFDDLNTVAKEAPDAIVIPKADERSLITADMYLDSAEKKHGFESGSIKLIPLIETAYGITHALSILSCSKRINGVILGMEDLSKDLWIVRTKYGTEARFARDTLVCCAKTCDIDVIDTPYTDIHDLDGLKYDATEARKIGFTGKTCIHPKHAEVINVAFSPTQDEIDAAKRLLAAFKKSLAAGKGACMIDGKMVDKPVAERAETLLKKAELAERAIRQMACGNDAEIS